MEPYKTTDNILNTKIYKTLNENDYYIDKSHSHKTHRLYLSDYVLSFFNGNKWVIIPLILCLEFPIIYLDYLNDESKKIMTMSLLLCPMTLRTTCVEGKFIFKKYIGGNMAFENDEKEIIHIDIGYKINTDFEMTKYRRQEIRINTLRNSLIEYQDCIFLIPKKRQLMEFNINLDYYKNKLNIDGTPFTYPNEFNYYEKTLVHIIQYSHNDILKTSIIVGNDANREGPSGYDNKLSKFNSYLSKYSDAMMAMKGFVIPMLLCHAMILYKDAKIIYL